MKRALLACVLGCFGALTARRCEWGCRISGQNSRRTFDPASTPRVIPADANPAETVRTLAGCQRREINPLPTAPAISLVATVFFPVVVLRVITVASNACASIGLNFV